ncbi:hypothetical protein Agub_g2334 [Astrephomene gubernaculifera]|uniref:GP-PDE domain-containing protein n=1 Tax=Astrephomene gubernaculifera TaxID=47775 RepID=A0AAD3DGY9_9CHLO|nr:hypothetical protein Agub_g2334 [Astrephomene gubernaculifera]
MRRAIANPDTKTPFLDRLTQLAANGINCYDIDVVSTADGKLVVGYPAQIAAELHSAGKAVPNGQLDAVPWSDYVAAGLEQRHPLLQDVLTAFARIALPMLGKQDQQQQQQQAASNQDAVGGSADGVAGSSDDASASAASSSGSSALGTEISAQHQGQQAQTQQQQHQQQRQQSQGEDQSQAAGRLRFRSVRQQSQQPQQQQSDTPPHRASFPPLLLIELKDRALTAAAALELSNASRALGVEQAVGLWLPRSPGAPAAAAEVGEVLRRAGANLLKVLALPDQSRLPNGTVVHVPLALQPEDSSMYDMFGPSTKHSDEAISQVAAAVAAAASAGTAARTGERRIVAWVVEGVAEAARAAQLGAGIVVSNDPVGLELGLAAVVKERCVSGGSLGAQEASGVGP